MHTGPTKLNTDKQTTLISADVTKAFYDSNEATFQAFLYLTPYNKTGQFSPCGTASNQPSCDTGIYPICECSAENNCSGCRHTGYTQILSIADLVTIEVLTAPDAGRQGKAMAQMTIKTYSKTASNSNQYTIETLVLPPIPFQRWTMLTISREGRRFDVYYNNSLVLSKHTTNVPLITPDISVRPDGVLSGSPYLNGEIALVDLENRKYTATDVATSYGRKADTRGTPYVVAQDSIGYRDTSGILPSYAPSFPGAFSLSLPSVNLCPSGNCLNLPTIRPKSPLYDFHTMYD